SAASPRAARDLLFENGRAGLESLLVRARGPHRAGAGPSVLWLDGVLHDFQLYLGPAGVIRQGRLVQLGVPARAATRSATEYQATFPFRGRVANQKPARIAQGFESERCPVQRDRSGLCEELGPG